MKLKNLLNLLRPQSLYQSLNMISISKSRIKNNLLVLQKLQPNHIIIPVVKSNAYGHGLKQICQILNTINKKQIPLIAVDSYPEYQIVESTTDKNILVLWETLSSNYHLYNSKRTHLAVWTIEVLQALINTKKHRNIHLFLNTGMNREWFQESSLKYALEEISKTKNIKIIWVMSHLANADINNNDFTTIQIKKFKNLYQTIIDKKHTPLYVHISNSAGISKVHDPIFNASRTWLSMYWYNPLEANDKYYSAYKWLQAALRITSTITALQYLKIGQWVSYGLTWIAKKPTTIATLPIWYNEGLPRLAGQWYTIYSNNNPLPLCGHICMNLCCCDIGDLALKVWEQIEIIWWDENKRNTILELSKIYKTIPYVILTNFNSSIKRIIIE